jgi:methylthioribose-1-phosphate isomerase
MVLQAIKYAPAGETGASLQIIDQLQLPHQSIYVPIVSCEDAWTAIRQMKVRGAPAIAIVASLSLAAELSDALAREDWNHDASKTRDLTWQRLEYLKTSRPTAVNLGDAVQKLKAMIDQVATRPGASGLTVVNAYIEAAEKMLVDDVKDNEAIGRHGADWIMKHTLAGQHKLRGKGQLKVLTHCNTGWGSKNRCSIGGKPRLTA